MHDAGTRYLGRARMPGQQTVEQGAGPVAGGRVHHQSGGFPDHQQVLVFVHHVQCHGLRHEGLGLLGRPQLDRQPVAGGDAGRGFGQRQAGAHHRAVGHELLQVGARELGNELCQCAVDGQLASEPRQGDQRPEPAARPLGDGDVEVR